MLIQIRLRRRWLLVGIVFFLMVTGVLGERWIAGTVKAGPQPIEQIKTDKKVIALTINVDWGEEYLPGILGALKEAKAKATFFVTGRWADKHSDLVKEMAAEGHEIENHGYSHPHPDRLSVAANAQEIQKTETIIEKITGDKTAFYAPPYGERGASGLKAAEQLGYKTILWTLDTVDWRADSTPEVIAERILNPKKRFGIQPEKKGAIVLMHPKENTLKALPEILKRLEAEGFQMLPLRELITWDRTGNTIS